MDRLRSLSRNEDLLYLLGWTCLVLALLLQGVSFLDRLNPEPAEIAQLASGGRSYVVVEQHSGLSSTVFSYRQPH
jgi:hypothetical protein